MLPARRAVLQHSTSCMARSIPRAVLSTQGPTLRSRHNSSSSSSSSSSSPPAHQQPPPPPDPTPSSPTQQPPSLNLLTKASRTTINIVKDEYSKSGGDAVVAEQTRASFGAGTRPERLMDEAGRGLVDGAANPLEVSPANVEVSRATVEKDGHPEAGVRKVRSSRRGSPAKGRAAEGMRTGKEMPGGGGMGNPT